MKRARVEYHGKRIVKGVSREALKHVMYRGNRAYMTDSHRLLSIRVSDEVEDQLYNPYTKEQSDIEYPDISRIIGKDYENRIVIGMEKAKEMRGQLRELIKGKRKVCYVEVLDNNEVRLGYRESGDGAANPFMNRVVYYGDNHDASYKKRLTLNPRYVKEMLDVLIESGEAITLEYSENRMEPISLSTSTIHGIMMPIREY